MFVFIKSKIVNYDIHIWKENSNLTRAETLRYDMHNKSNQANYYEAIDAYLNEKPSPVGSRIHG